MGNDDPPKEVCSKAPEGDKYKPKFFSTSALAMGKVDLTWDETDPQRIAAMQKAFDVEENEDALKAYIATSSGEEDQRDGRAKIGDNELSDSDDDKVIAKYRALLTQGGTEEADGGSSGDNEDNDGTGMEMTFVPEADKKKVQDEISFEKMTPWQNTCIKRKRSVKGKEL